MKMSPRTRKIKFILSNVAAISVGILVGALVKTYAIPKNVIQRMAFWVGAMALGGMASEAAAKNVNKQFDETYAWIREVREIINAS